VDSASKDVRKSVIDFLDVLGGSNVDARSKEPLTAGHLEARQPNGLFSDALDQGELISRLRDSTSGGFLGAGGLGGGIGTLLDGVNVGRTGADPGVSSRDILNAPGSAAGALGPVKVSGRSTKPLTAGHLDTRQSGSLVDSLSSTDDVLKSIGGFTTSPGGHPGGLFRGGLGSGIGTLVSGINQGLTSSSSGVLSRDIPRY
jgi:hypothetical protein